MAILLDEKSRVIVQGMTGREGRFHSDQMRKYGTAVVGGVTPGKGGQDLEGIPLFDTVEEAVKETNATATGIFVPPPFAADAIMEAATVRIPLIVCITEGVPVADMVKARALCEEMNVRLLGPNCPGLMTPDSTKIGIIPNHIGRKGSVGIVARSGTLTYEVIQGLSQAGFGQSTSVGIGGDPIHGLSFTDVLELFAEDESTESVVLIGEIGGSDEEEAADYIAKSFKKPVVAFISGRTAPPGKRMGHAGAIISGTSGSAAGKVAALERAGVQVAETIEDVVAGIAQLTPSAKVPAGS